MEAPSVVDPPEAVEDVFEAYGGAEPEPSEPPLDGIDDVAESAFRAEARARGELSTPIPSTAEADGADTQPLPPLEPLVERIAPEIRELLDELFRARFVAVRRVPAKALKREKN